MIVGPRRNRHNNTSSEWIIEVLCLEDTAIRRGIIARRQRTLEWLDLEGNFLNCMEGVNADAWSSSSFNREGDNNSGEPVEIIEPTVGGEVLEEPIPPQPQDQDAASNQHKEQADDKEDIAEPTTNEKALEEPIPPQPQEQGASGSNIMTPKRKLSPTPMTPTGIPRKITTQMQGSPLLRETFETIGMEIENDLIGEHSNPLGGIENLMIGEGDDHHQATTPEQSNNQPQTPRIVRRPRFRFRATSVANIASPGRRPRRQRILSERDITSPGRQLRITDIFKSQQNLVQDSIQDPNE